VKEGSNYRLTEWRAQQRPLIIGQAPARGNDGLRPFAGKSGARLAQLAGLGDTGDVLWPNFDLLNLMKQWPGKNGTKGDDFDMGEARAAVEDILIGLAVRPPSYILLMGRKVETAFRIKKLPYLERYALKRKPLDRHRVIVFPHPSGINHWWNDAENAARAARVMRGVLRASRPQAPDEG
jgi:uracil-DNA glycosylase